MQHTLEIKVFSVLLKCILISSIGKLYTYEFVTILMTDVLNTSVIQPYSRKRRLTLAL